MKYGLKNNQRVCAQPGVEATCPLCKSDLVPKCGTVIIWHFAHKQIISCDSWYEPESEWHRDWKELFKQENQEIIIEKDGKKHIADVKLGDEVVEFQNSTISSEDIVQRENFYGKMMWVINGNTLGKGIELRIPDKDREIAVKEMEKKLGCDWDLKLYFPGSCPDCGEKLLDIEDKKMCKNHGEREPIKLPANWVNLFAEGYYCPWPIPNEIHPGLTGFRTFRWKHPPKSWWSANKQIIIDLGDTVFEIKKIYEDIPCGGWGNLIDKEKFIEIMKSHE